MKRCLTIPRKINLEEDKISKLPDEVLVSILSLLTTKEAARTSVVARRWLKLWTFCPSLNFGNLQILSIYGESRMASEEEKQRYVDCVNRAMEAFQGSTIDDFQVHFDLDSKYKCDIDRWVDFVIQKGVKRLAIDLCVYAGRTYPGNVYNFPPLCNSSALQRTLLLLRVLKLKNVNVSGAVIEYFISACTCLEKLTIRRSSSQDLVHLNVTGGQSHCLKKVKVFDCQHLKRICLSATNLLSFKYRGWIIDISYANVPNLVQVFLGGRYLDFGAYLPQLSKYVFQLQTLTLNVPVLEDEEYMGPLAIPVLTNLKNLTLRVFAYNSETLRAFTSLMKAFPSLNRLAVQFTNMFDRVKSRRERTLRKSSLRCLKEVELVGFVGRTLEMEFATFLIENAVMLEKIIIDPIPHRFVGSRAAYLKKRMQTSRECAMRLGSKFSLGDKLVLRNLSSI
ncbi:putative F-box/FBD/LRR-repeat protein At1g78760 isoform X2 [Tripterygium wilfordii]|uniref:putative F-box/FBD/LRR-repeat protein At1g78760 isoform X2 n=1 Tax=Tripterygium wilfordii TaxID=458696 RepID=UPI0018F85A87|nr:putative F-box/FBD/LRR-repeat protein At1g78760 isoform X2 [Tripterygium wilfordii]